MEDFVENVYTDSQADEPVAETTETVDETVETATEEEQVEKRSIANDDAEKHRRLRDEYNAQTKQWKSKRDALNAQVRELIEQAGLARIDRDNYNQQVRDAKVVREEKNKVVVEIREKLAQLRPEKAPKSEDEVSLPRLKKQLRDLETVQMTQPLGREKENAIVKQISTLARQIEEKESEDQTSAEVKEIIAQFKVAKTEAEEAHRQVAYFAEQAQAKHDEMLSYYEKADTLRKEADAAQAKFMEYKNAADEEHKKHIEQITAVREFDKSAAESKKKSGAKKKSVDHETQKAAQEIFDRFKKGEKLSTEDLMILQKTGFL